MEIQSIIFDLDDTLFDTSGQLLTLALEESLKTFHSHSIDLDIEKLKLEYTTIQNNHPNKNIFLSILQKFNYNNFPLDTLNNIANTIESNFYNRRINVPIYLFNGCPETLTKLKKHYRLFLVTYGHPATQIAKIDALDLKPYFEKIYLIGRQFENRKTTAFNEILLSANSHPHSYLCVGNRRDSEIRDAKKLGFRTCLVNHGEHKIAQPKDELEVPDFTIDQISEIITTCKL